MITSVHNKCIKEAVALLAKKKERDRRGLFVVEGGKMFGEAPAQQISRVYLAQSAEKEMTAKYGDKLSGLSCEIVADDVFARMSDTVTPQGILCLVRQRRYNIEEILQGDDKKQMLFIVLEDIQDPGNLGTVIRTAEAAGADGVIMSSRTADIYNPKTIRSTMGAVFRVPFLYTEDLSSVIKMLQGRGTAVYAAHLGAKDFYDAFDYRQSTAFLIGNEANGLRDETAGCADTLLGIPMEGRVESLNAAVASSILLYEAYRQRRKG
ncbi:MAG: RNA methyltransferase [Lachnospiraceae bacterium]|nr:RNA methyltransferase [Lachnospiraceae bacterium]